MGLDSASSLEQQHDDVLNLFLYVLAMLCNADAAALLFVSMCRMLRLARCALSVTLLSMTMQWAWLL